MNIDTRKFAIGVGLGALVGGVAVAIANDHANKENNSKSSEDIILSHRGSIIDAWKRYISIIDATSDINQAIKKGKLTISIEQIDCDSSITLRKKNCINLAISSKYLAEIRDAMAQDRSSNLSDSVAHHSFAVVAREAARAIGYEDSAANSLHSNLSRDLYPS